MLLAVDIGLLLWIFLLPSVDFLDVFWVKIAALVSQNKDCWKDFQSWYLGTTSKKLVSKKLTLKYYNATLRKIFEHYQRAYKTLVHVWFEFYRFSKKCPSRLTIPLKCKKKRWKLIGSRYLVSRFTLGFYISGAASHQSRQDTITNVLPTAKVFRRTVEDCTLSFIYLHWLCI